MKRLLLSSALIAMAAPALAQTASPVPPTPAPEATAPAVETTGIFRGEPVTDAVYASEFIGSTLYTADTQVRETGLIEASPDWDAIGEVNDIIISRDGTVEVVLADVGGFLGMGERTVAVNMDAIQVVMDSDTPGDYFLVFTANREALEAAPEYQLPETMTSARAPDAAATPQAPAGAVPVTPAPAPADTAGMGTASPMDGYTPVEFTAVRAGDLDGVNVYDANNESVGSISEVLLTADGTADRAVIDVGGFLGIGAKPVAVNLTDLTLYKQADGDDLRAATALTKDQLKAMPGYSDS